MTEDGGQKGDVCPSPRATAYRRLKRLKIGTALHCVTSIVRINGKQEICNTATHRSIRNPEF